MTLDCSVAGVGVDPEDPPLAWDAWTGDGWAPCEVERDGTGGFNKAGDVVVHVPRGHRVSNIGRSRGGWLRVRLVEPRPDQPTYSQSPVLRSAAAAVLGGTVTAVHADRVRGEVLGESDGVAAQRFSLQRRPIVPGDTPTVVEVAEPLAAGGSAWREWQVVEDFGDSGPQDRHVVLDSRSGELSFGPLVREPDGGVRQLGRVPEPGAVVRVREYRTGGGAAGNVGAGTLVVLTSSLPFIGEVVNRASARGGQDAEDIEQAKARGPVVLRHRGRAVTAEDFEHLSRAAAPEVARVRAVAAGSGAEAGGVRVLVVPAVPTDERLDFGRLVPERATLQRIADALDGARLLTTRVVVEPPAYQGVTVVAAVRAGRRGDPRVSRPGSRRRWTGGSRRWSAGRTARAGPSAAPSTSARCTGCCRRSPGSTSSRTSACTPPIPSSVSGATPPSASSSTRTPSSSASTTRCGSRRWTGEGHVPGLPTRHPLGPELPALYQDDPFTQRLLAGLDEVLAPVLAVLDALDSYIDPRTAPLDLLRWVGSGWLGVEVDPAWTDQRQRDVVQAAVRVHAGRGTGAALVEWLLLVHGLHAEVIESGGVAVHEVPGGELPGDPGPFVRVRLKGATAAQVALAGPLVRDWCPAHAVVEVEAAR